MGGTTGKYNEIVFFWLKNNDVSESSIDLRRRKERRAEVKLEDGSLTTVEYIETSGEEIIAADDMITRGDLEGSTVILDPVGRTSTS